MISTQHLSTATQHLTVHYDVTAASDLDKRKKHAIASTHTNPSRKAKKIKNNLILIMLAFSRSNMPVLNQKSQLSETLLHNTEM